MPPEGKSEITPHTFQPGSLLHSLLLLHERVLHHIHPLLQLIQRLRLPLTQLNTPLAGLHQVLPQTVCLRRCPPQPLVMSSGRLSEQRQLRLQLLLPLLPPQRPPVGLGQPLGQPLQLLTLGG